MYQQTRLSDTNAIGAPGDLPSVIATWGDAPGLLADLTGHVDPQFGFDGTGFWPVDVTTPAFDPAAQVLVPPTACDKADPVAKRWTATATVRAMTNDEFTAANPVPEIISDRQCFQQLANLGKVTQAEALAAVQTGTMPDIVTNGIQALPEQQQFPAHMIICGATQFYRSSVMTPVFLSFFKMDSADGDALWRAASLL